jgi:hypothetical protein
MEYGSWAHHAVKGLIAVYVSGSKCAVAAAITALLSVTDRVLKVVGWKSESLGVCQRQIGTSKPLGGPPQT